MRIGERLGVAIKASGMTLKEFSAQTGIPYRTLQDYIGGQREPRADIIAQICTRARVSPAWLLLGEGDMFQGEPSDDGGADKGAVSEDAAGYTHQGEDGPFARRIAALVGLLTQLDPEHADGILSSALSRATDAQRLAVLERAVAPKSGRKKRP